MFEAVGTSSGDLSKDLAALGLSELLGSLVEDVCEVWTCNWPTVSLFIRMQTQWRIGMTGPTGLDYSALPLVAKAFAVRLNRQRIQGIIAMEREALKVMDERREKREINHGH